jgi:ATP-dependent exoDNAse (exonuclease V) beta subunit
MSKRGAGRMKPYLALEASAGSGKTFALSVRYLSLLFMGAHPQKIVALTFTNKAASEMKTRIFETLKHLEAKDELEAICRQTGRSKEAILAQKEHVMHLLLQADIKISTLDAFFALILRHFSLHLGIQSDFSVGQKAMNEALKERFIQICKRKNLYRALLALSLGEDKKLNDIFEILDVLYQKKSEIDLNRLPKATFPVIEPLLKRLEAMRNVFEQKGLGQSALKTFEASDLREMLSKKYLEREDFGYWHYKKYTDETLDALLRDFKRALHTFVNEKEAYVLGELGALLGAYEESIQSVIQSFGELRFDDVTNLLYRLLRREIDRDFLYFRLDGAIEHLLIDEFQDTSIVQFEILLPLIEEIRSGQGVQENKTLFFVGDVKQSIYRFRGGAKELFGYAKRSLSLECEALDTNYRSRFHVVDFVNQTFSNRIKGYEPQKVAKDEQSGYVRVCLSETIEEELKNALEQLISQRVEPKDIAVLVHTNKDAQRFKAYIEEHFPSLHVRLEATLKLTQVVSIRMLISLLKYLYFHDELYKAEFLSLRGHTWEEALDWREWDMNVAPLLLLSRLMKRFELFDGSHDMLSFLEAASRYEDMESFLFALEELSDEAKSEDKEGLRVLTVHKSKGLEFEHVIVCDRLGKENNRSDTLLFDYNEVSVQGVYVNMAGRETIDPLYAKAKERERALQDEDRLNALYVAFTRAKRSLIVCAKEQNSVFSMLDISPPCEIGSIDASHKAHTSLVEPVSVFLPRHYGAQDVSKTEEIPSEAMGAMAFGTAQHYLLEMLDAFNIDALKRAYIALQNRFAPLLDEQSMQMLYRRGEHLVTCKDFLSLIEGAKLYKEQPIFYKNERKQIDLLLERDDRWVIIDYKSSTKDAPKHHAQVAQYQEALQQMVDKPVEAYICYLRNDGVTLEKSL